MTEGSDLASEAEEQLSPELKQEVRLARRVFTGIERMTNLTLSYPPGHPMVEEASEQANNILYEYFELTDRLSVLIDAHSLKFLGTDEVVWRTEEPRDYCWALSRDGVYLIHILAGIDAAELRLLVDVLNELVDESDLSKNAVTVMFEAGFRYLSFDAIDESLAQLAGLEMDIRNRDTKEEQEQIEDLFDDIYDKEAKEDMSPEEAARQHQEEFEVRMQKRSKRQKRMEVGSREFLMLDERAQKHLKQLLKGFSEHAELEHREGEILAAILGARPKEKLRLQAEDQIGEVMGGLLETNQPWESLEFLKIIHAWRQNFDDVVTGELKDVVADCFTKRRISALIKMVAREDAKVRRSILQMFNALHLDEASAELVRLLGWDVEEEVRKDVLRYLRERSRFGLGFIRETIFELPTKDALPLLDIVIHWMPKSRNVLLEVVKKPCEPELKARAITALSGTWTGEETREILEPLLDASNDKVRLAALRSLADAAPKSLMAILAPRLNQDLASRPEEEAREMASLFLQHGGEKALAKLEELIRVRGVMVSDSDKELAVTLAKMIARSPKPGVKELLRSVGKDFLVPGKVRSTCKELASLLER